MSIVQAVQLAPFAQRDGPESGIDMFLVGVDIEFIDESLQGIDEQAAFFFEVMFGFGRHEGGAFDFSAWPIREQIEEQDPDDGAYDGYALVDGFRLAQGSFDGPSEMPDHASGIKCAETPG